MRLILPEWPAPPSIKAFTTTRVGFNGLLSNDEKKHELARLFSLPTEPIWIKQIHSSIAIEARPENKGKEADASIAHIPQHICVVTTADCLPILICNRSGTHVAAIHAGWRGLAHGILEATLASLPPPKDHLMAWLGPAISSSKFEVGKDVYDAFTHNSPEASEAFIARSSEKWFADLYHLARIRLNAQGVTQIYGGHFCTYTQRDLFFSYRRDKSLKGCMASLIWIEDK